MPNCYLCGAPSATHPLKLAGQYNAHDIARSPESDRLCDRCNLLIPPGAELQYAYYWNEQKQSWSRVFTRNTSWLLRDPDNLWSDRNLPYFTGKRDEGKGAHHELVNMPKLVDIRAWLLDPPDPPFQIAIAESGQKHILYLARTATSRDRFPVQFELNTAWIERQSFAELVNNIESLLAAGFSKTEIRSNQPRIDKLAKNLTQWQQHYPCIAHHANSPTLAIALSIARLEETYLGIRLAR